MPVRCGSRGAKWSKRMRSGCPCLPRASGWWRSEACTASAYSSTCRRRRPWGDWRTPAPKAGPFGPHLERLDDFPGHLSVGVIPSQQEPDIGIHGVRHHPVIEGAAPVFGLEDAVLVRTVGAARIMEPGEVHSVVGIIPRGDEPAVARGAVLVRPVPRHHLEPSIGRFHRGHESGGAGWPVPRALRKEMGFEGRGQRIADGPGTRLLHRWPGRHGGSAALDGLAPCREQGRAKKKKGQAGAAHQRCMNAFLASSWSSDSRWSGSSTQQSTGQTAAHWGSSWKPTHSVHLSVAM